VSSSSESGAPRSKRVVKLAVAGAVAAAIAGFGIAAALPASAATTTVEGGGLTAQTALQDGFMKCASMGYAYGGTALSRDVVEDEFGNVEFWMFTVECV